MSKNRFNEAEAYLLCNWQQARSVEKTMEEIRAKYAEVIERVWAATKAQHKELDWYEAYVTQFWCDGYINIGRSNWQISDNYAYIGIDNLRLEILSDDNAERPYIGIYAGTSRKPAMEVGGIRKVLSAAGRILPKDKFSWEKQDDPSEYAWVLWYDLPARREELLEMLLDGDGQRFVDFLAEHFGVFTKFIPVLDEVFSKPKK